ncbi:hypothetical protein UFOVP60_2 [uncultured Caudovirales phage]|uniref:Uncharacterized protein n=1 Tax=uncultured Caudovirales phage TaxID=2100421 RepID=A0A6J5T974_9CAUD|nr:hypothetical protein UFOVP60_2 [uncultured Caudovirales phage]
MVPLMWAAAGQAVLGAVKGIAAAGVNKAQAEANNKISASNAEAETSIRAAGNQAKAAENSLGLWSQSINNARRQKQVGGALESTGVNAFRQLDSAVQGHFSGSIREAEQEGAQAAAAAEAGVEGGVADQVAAASALRRQIGEEMSVRATGQATSDVGRRAGILTSQLLSGLDTRAQMAGLDYNRSVTTAFKGQGMLRGAVEGILSSGAIQTAIAGMQAGNPDKTPKMGAESAGGLATREVNLNAVGGTGDIADFAFDTNIRLGEGGGNQLLRLHGLPVHLGD